jgi:FkbM family methyltransferase
MVRPVTGQPTDFQEGAFQRLRRRIGWKVRDTWPHRRVVREIQGVRMTLPWSSRLPDYTKGDSPYSQNLVQLARLLTKNEPVVVIDIGANVGDSALQIAAATDAEIICVEGDPYYVDFLTANTAGDPRFHVEPGLLVPDQAEGSMRPVRTGGTTRFVTAGAPASAPSVTAVELRRRHPCTERLRLVKSDTDGYDVSLVPTLARAWADRHPVLFFEYDLGLSRLAGLDPLQVWDDLADLGYRHVAVWGNGGHPLWRAGVAEMVAASQVLDGPKQRYQPTYWDVAVVHADDESGHAAIKALVPSARSTDPD